MLLALIECSAEHPSPAQPHYLVFQSGPHFNIDINTVAHTTVSLSLVKHRQCSSKEGKIEFNLSKGGAESVLNQVKKGAIRATPLTDFEEIKAEA
ncbi:hypothetical protein DICVIV_13342 [Dictyocaulus viviparus]|uniref:Uncharacterized protein n=1 Tax=Dictyocaulus viviparus TaxID=29172 RepID=A0A0D8X822_DICVI|nr:hypothetical protein DICVIV_13342 [Dictyocaulus viviparus]